MSGLSLVLVVARMSALVWLLVEVVPHTFSRSHSTMTTASENLREKNQDKDKGQG